MKRLTLLVVILVVAVPGAWAQSYYVVPDVPSNLAGADHLPWEIVRNDAGVYSVTTVAGPLAHIDALHRLGSGDFLISVSSMRNLGGIDWDRRDVFLYTTAGVYAGYPPYGGAVAQIPEGSNVDAVFVDPASKDIVVSFDVPTTIAGITYGPSDLVRYAAGAFGAVPLFDASVAGLPDSANVTAADVRAGRLFLSFDAPVSLGAAVTFLPGEIVRWDGVSFALFDTQPGWPSLRSSRVNAFSFLADPGTNDPTVLTVPQPGLQISIAGPGLIQLTWTPASCGGGEDWGVFEGTLGTFPVYSHLPVTCSTGGVPSYLHAYGPGDTYYLVVPNNPNDEGSEGFASFGGVPVDRSGPPVCKPTRATTCSP